jgi:hypothetical protein
MSRPALKVAPAAMKAKRLMWRATYPIEMDATALDAPKQIRMGPM